MNEESSLRAALSGHDLGKSRRRQAIVDAARMLIEEEGEAAFTMRRLAAEAKVSVPTPYNLFGSKEAVVRAVMDDDRARFDEEFRATAAEHPLERIFDVIDGRFETYRADPSFHRALARCLYQVRESDGDHSIWHEHIAYGTQLIDEAVKAGCVERHSGAFLGRALIRTYHSALLEWISEEVELDTAHRDVCLSVAILLSAYVTSEHRNMLQAVRTKYELAPRNK